eukprot:2254536-Prorocentrum_lima.AAC.1
MASMPCHSKPPKVKDPPCQLEAPKGRFSAFSQVARTFRNSASGAKPASSQAPKLSAGSVMMTFGGE